MLSDLLHHQASHFSLKGDSHEMYIYFLEGHQQIKRILSVSEIYRQKLLTSKVTHNFDKGYQKLKKKCSYFMFRERHPLSKALKPEILFKMQKKLKMIVNVYFIHLSLYWF